jgi:CHAT domain-containing protein/tetratricopeptide (TPR) repeat protein
MLSLLTGPLFAMTIPPVHVTRYRCVLVLCALALAISLSVASPDARGRAAAQEPAAIVPGAAIDRPIAAGETHRFRLQVTQGQAIKVSVDQLGVDVRVTLDLAPAPTAARDDESKHHFGRELLVWRAPASGLAQIAVAAKSAVPAGGSYHLAVSLFDPSDTVTRAVTALDDGIRLAGETTRASAEQAADSLQQAAQDWTTLGDRELAAAALHRLGVLQLGPLAAPADAMATEHQALAIYEALGLATESVDALGEIVSAQIQLGQEEQALVTSDRAYAHAASIDPMNRARLETDMAHAATGIGDLDRGLQFAQRAVETFHAAGASYDESLALERLAITYMQRRTFDLALQTITRSLALGRQYGKPADVASLTATLGRIQMTAGDDEAALAALRRAIDLFGDDAINRIDSQLSMARIYNRLGDAQAARTLLEGAMRVTPPQVKSLWAGLASELGFTLVQLGEPAGALDLQQKALEIVQGQTRLGQLVVLRDLAGTYRTLGRHADATRMIDRAFAIDDALPGKPYASMFLHERARNARAAGDLVLARQQLDLALEALDTERGQLRTQALRASFGGSVASYYTDAIDIAMAMHAEAPEAGHEARAFELFERSRARSLTELLSEARVDITAGVDPALLAERRDLMTQLGRTGTALRNVHSDEAGKARAEVLEGEIEDLVRRLEVLGGRIRATSPRYASVSHPAPPSLPQTQMLLDDDTVLLAFSIAEPTSWGWAITRTGVRSFPLPAAKQIEAQAQRVYAGLTARQRHDGPVAPADRQLAVDATALSDLVLGPIAAPLQGEWRNSRLAIIATGPLEYIPFGALPLPTPKPAAAPPSSIATTKENATATIAAPKPAAAATVPIAATTEKTPPATARTVATAATGATATTGARTQTGAPAVAAGTASRAWLVDQHEIVQLPSAAVLALLRNDSASRPAPSTQVAVIADPVYSIDDSRVPARARATGASRDAVAMRRTGKASAAGAGAGVGVGVGAQTQTGGAARVDPGLGAAGGSDPMSAQFERLIFSRKEAQAIARLAPVGSAIEALDFSANMQTIASPAVASARIVHVASHGIFNSARPELSGLVLSLVDQQGRPEEGVLRLYDIFNLKLSADLVVLSGCETGLGRQMKGEGLIGLTRAFMYAGAPRVVASRWQVDDVATAELMSRFYAGIFQKHLAPAAALHAAQQQMRAVPRWQSPYYWAAFTLLGDWR